MDKVNYVYPPMLNSVSAETSYPSFVALKGADSITEVTANPNSGGGTNSLRFSIQPPSTSTLVDSVIMLECQVACNVVAADPARALALGGLCLESWPLNKSIQNISVSINGNAITAAPYQFMSIFEKFEHSEEFNKVYGSTFPTRLNGIGANYNAMALNDSQTAGPFALKSLDADIFNCSRANFPYVDTLTATGVVVTDNVNTVGNRTRTWTIREPLWLGSVLHTAGNAALCNINTLDISIQFLDMAATVLCDPTDPADKDAKSVYIDPFYTGAVADRELIASAKFLGVRQANAAPSLNAGQYVVEPASMTVTRAAEKLLLRYMTATAEVPSSVSIPYTEVKQHLYSVANTAIAAGAKRDIYVNAIKTNQVPSFIYIVVRNQLIGAAKDRFRHEYQHKISKISLLVDNRQGVLSGATPEQLHQMTFRNGYNRSKKYWDQGSCVLCIKMGNDVGGFPGGTLGQFALETRLEIENTSGVEIPANSLEVAIFFSQDGMLEINPSSSRVILGVLQSAATQELAEAPIDVDESRLEGAGYVGGSAKSFFRSLGRALKPIGNVGLNVLEKVAVPVATKLLLGAGDAGVMQSADRMRRLRGGTKLMA